MRSTSGVRCCLFFAIVVFGNWGCTPQVAVKNRKIVEALQTAVTAKNEEWLDAVGAQVAIKREKKEMSDSEFTAIDSIFKKAKSGDWKRAQADSFALTENQKPTPQDLANLKERKSSKELSSK